MSRINKHNYEAFMLDSLEGNLSKELQLELDAFLELNPALESASFDLSQATLIAPEMSNDQKELLKKTDEEIALSPIEKLLIGDIEGTNDVTQGNVLQAEILANPSLEKERKVFKSTKLIAPVHSYPNKASLKKRGVILLSPILRIAASILLLAIVYFAFIKKTDKEPILANKNTPLKETVVIKKTKPEINTIEEKKVKVIEEQKESILPIQSNSNNSIKTLVNNTIEQPPIKEETVFLLVDTTTIIAHEPIKNDPTPTVIQEEKVEEEEEWLSASNFAYVAVKKEQAKTANVKTQLASTIKKIINE